MRLKTQFVEGVCSAAIYCALVLVSLPSGAAEKIVRIGLANVMEDPGSDASIPHGDYFRKGVITAFDRFASDFKRKKIKIEFVAFDYKAGGTDATRAATQAVNSEVSAVIGYNYSDHVFLAEPIHTRAGLSMITPYGTANRIARLGKFIFQIPFNNEHQGRILAQVVGAHVPKGKIVAIVAKDCSYCTDLLHSFNLNLPGAAVRVVEIPILSDQSNLEKLFSDMKPQIAGARAIFVPNTELLSVRIISKLIAAGIKGPFYGGDGWSDYGYRLFKHSISEPIEAYSVTHWDAKVATGSSKEFVKNFQTQWSLSPYGSAALAYDAGVFVATAVNNCSEYSREALNSCLSEVKKIRGSMEEFSPSKGGQPSSRGGVLMKLNRKNDFTLVRYISGKQK
jgi:ABC-type branched-subunit amino acid transport system substrate-binding protein